MRTDAKYWQGVRRDLRAMHGEQELGTAREEEIVDARDLALELDWATTPRGETSVPVSRRVLARVEAHRAAAIERNR